MYLHLHSPGSDSYPLPQWEIQETTGQWHHRRKDQKPRSPPGLHFLFHPLGISWVTLNLSSFNLRRQKFETIFSIVLFLYAWSDVLPMTEEVKIHNSLNIISCPLSPFMDCFQNWRYFPLPLYILHNYMCSVHIGTLFQDHAVVTIATALMVDQPLRNEVWRIWLTLPIEWFAANHHLANTLDRACK